MKDCIIDPRNIRDSDCNFEISELILGFQCGLWDASVAPGIPVHIVEF